MSEHGPQVPTQTTGGVVKMTYCPGRDFINIYPAMFYNLAVQFDNGYWDKLIIAAGIDADIVEAKNKVSDVMLVVNKFIEQSCADETEGFTAVLTRAGWDTIDPKVQQLFTAMLGHLMLGQLFVGIRDVSASGEVPPAHWLFCLEKFWRIAAESAGPKKLTRWQKIKLAWHTLWR